MTGYATWQSSEVGDEDLLFENRNSISPSFGLDMDWNQNILKGGGAKICPGLDSYYLKLRRQLCLTLSSFNHWSLHIFLIAVFVVDPKMLCGFSGI